MPVIFGVNPVLEALHSKQPVDKIFLLSSKKGNIIKKIYTLAKKEHIPVVQADRKKMEKLTGGADHRGIAAILAPVKYIELEDLLNKIDDAKEMANLIILDRIQDPHNFGAIIRSAEILGAHGIIFSLKENVPITNTVVNVSAGALFHIDMCKVSNLSQTVSILKETGLWIYSSSVYGKKNLWEVDFIRPQATIIGSEGKGIRPLLLKLSDEIFYIQQQGKTESLNASVAAGIILSEIQKQRQ